MKYSISRSIITCLLSGMLALCAGLFAAPTASARDVTRIADVGAYQLFENVKNISMDNGLVITDDLHYRGPSRDGYDTYEFMYDNWAIEEHFYTDAEGDVLFAQVRFRREEKYASIASRLLTYTGMAAGIRPEDVTELVERIEFQSEYQGYSPIRWVESIRRNVVISICSEAGSEYAFYTLAAFGK